MEPTELEKNLGDLEDKIDRVRALYEQYFVGIEKLEPQIPRKDVERILVVMRKEQIRNTAMRFKFQTLVQRFNTMQQHWGRTMREIENGTFRRDVLKAAARFGAEDALTAVGKRQADKLKKVIEAQRERLGSKQARGKNKSEVYEEVSSSDVEMMDDDDDAPTPPPVHNINAEDAQAAYAQQQAYAQQGYYDAQGYPAQGYPGQVNPGYEQQGYPAQQQAYGYPEQQYQAQHYQGQHSQGQHSQGQQQAGYPPQQAGYPQDAQYGQQYPQQQQYQAQYQQSPQHETGLQQQPRPGFAAPAGVFAPPVDPLSYGESVGDAPSAAEPVKKKGGLRWGGGGGGTAGGRRADPEALKRIASLADGGSSSAHLEETAAPAPAAPAAPVPRRPLLSSPIDLGLPEEPTSIEPQQHRRPLLSSPIDIEVGSEPPPPMRAAAPSNVAASVQDAAPASRRASTPEERPRPQLRPPPSADAVHGSGSAKPQGRPPPSQREFGDLNDGRLREIYGQYVQARRERNESTAGITFEKLADSLRSQADKLKGKHVSKRVDYEVVVKEGKTLIKPIVK